MTPPVHPNIVRRSDPAHGIGCAILLVALWAIVTVGMVLIWRAV